MAKTESRQRRRFKAGQLVRQAYVCAECRWYSLEEAALCKCGEMACPQCGEHVGTLVYRSGDDGHAAAGRLFVDLLGEVQ